MTHFLPQCQGVALQSHKWWDCSQRYRSWQRDKGISAKLNWERSQTILGILRCADIKATHWKINKDKQMETILSLETKVESRCMPLYLEKAMVPHSSTLAWKIPWMEEPSRLQSMGSLRVGHDWATPLSLFTFMHWRRKWQPTPVFLPGESQGRGSLVGCHLWGHTELDTTEVT